MFCISLAQIHSEIRTSPLERHSHITTLGCRTLVADVPILHRHSHLFELPQDLNDWFPTAEAERHRKFCIGRVFKMASHRDTPFIEDVPHQLRTFSHCGWTLLLPRAFGGFRAPLFVRRSAASIGVQPL